MKLSLESSDDIANFYGWTRIIKKETKVQKKKADEIRKVTANQIQTSGELYF